ncbi:PQQ-binding-like beta-propeller repeat protein [Phenylobacterium sp.]|uniref:outer membrane protein assembly factor BamB family protein n=1 Tax=Phenylobacterium sp. TaxID=1871053 RepID=UPI0025DD113D|nr:PQQ-binding-like beta-propeller repeat protein [Phenylobacterium sp.]MBX3482912.1 PQQ-binding-like beta-propeller repeat protein [Phenylobacterium sp.]MCW5758868.1 PQQ-binding-like beta-propeller repeat protein [Phenylobacterium sp.]
MRLWKQVLGAGAVSGALLIAGFGLGGLGRAEAQATGGPDDPGKPVYDQFCAACHNAPPAGDRAPPVASLRKMSAQTIMAALTTGVMKPIGDGLDRRQIRDVVQYLAAPEGATGTAWIDDNRCAADKATVDLSAAPAQVGFGVDTDNSRRMTAAQAGFTGKQAADLEVAWTFAMPRTSGLRGQGVVVGSTLFFPAGQAGYMLALDTKTGCVKWATPANGLRTSLAYGRLGKNGPWAVVGGDSDGELVAFDARTGAVAWKADPRHDKTVPLSGSPVFAGDRIVVPISAIDVGNAMRPTFECCKAHGAVALVDAKDGKVLWTWHTMPEAQPLGRKNSQGVEMYGPSGAPIWSSPSVDLKAGVVYTATGENTSPPATGTSDALVAIDLATGKQKWAFQALANDVWNMSCPIGSASGPGQRKPGPNCFFAEEGSVLRDHDFGGGPVIWKGKGKSLILGGQKSGDVWAVDAKTGKQVWHHQFGKGTALGGVHWGIATDGVRVFAPISDPGVPPADNAAGLYAIDIASGKVAWSWKATPDCTGERRTRVAGCDIRYGVSAPPLVVDGAVIAGSLDGRLHVFDAATGKRLATHDTSGSFETVNRLAGKGGSIDAAGPFAGDGMLFVPSGYVQFGQTAGNVLVAYRPKR